MKIKHCKIIASLVGIILLLSLYIITAPPKIEIKEIEVLKEIVVEVEKEVIKEPTYKYIITSVEREMLARIVHRESNTESLECQIGITSVIINRWQDGRWGNTLSEVIYAPHQFSPSGLIYKTTPTETNYQAVDYVLKNGSTLPKYVMFFRANFGFSSTNWANKGYKEYTQVDNTFFGYFEKDIP